MDRAACLKISVVPDKTPLDILGHRLLQAAMADSRKCKDIKIHGVFLGLDRHRSECKNTSMYSLCVCLDTQLVHMIIVRFLKRAEPYRRLVFQIILFKNKYQIVHWTRKL